MKPSKGSEKISSSRKRYVRQILAIDGSHIDSQASELEAQKAKITFFENYAFVTHPYNDDPMDITVGYDEWEIKKS